MEGRRGPRTTSRVKKYPTGLVSRAPALAVTRDRSQKDANLNSELVFGARRRTSDRTPLSPLATHKTLSTLITFLTSNTRMPGVPSASWVAASPSRADLRTTRPITQIWHHRVQPRLFNMSKHTLMGTLREGPRLGDFHLPPNQPSVCGVRRVKGTLKSGRTSEPQRREADTWCQRWDSGASRRFPLNARGPRVGRRTNQARTHVEAPRNERVREWRLRLK